MKNNDITIKIRRFPGGRARRAGDFHFLLFFMSGRNLGGRTLTKCPYARHDKEAGFGEGTPQQVRPERAATISICEIVATGRYLLFTFSISFENPDSKADTGFQNWAWECEYERKCLCLFAVYFGSSSCPCFAAALSGSSVVLRSHGTVSSSDG